MENSQRELRFMVTQRCTNDCFFCHGEGMQLKKQELLSAEDYHFVFNVARLRFGFENTTLSGGEPLIRKDIMDIAARLHNDRGKITLTSNGFLLEEKIYVGSYLDRLNVSVHSLDENVYESLSGRSNFFHKIIYGLKQFRTKFPDVEIRLNTTLVKGVNSDEDGIVDLLNFATKLNASIKFIELYPSSAKEFVSVDKVEEIILRRGFKPIISTTRKRNYYNGVIEVGLTKIFCASACDQENPVDYCIENNDLFISPDGTIKPCRHNIDEIDIMPEVLARDADGLYAKFLNAFGILGKDCIHAKQ